jgi:hypothetical protein
MSLSRKSYVEDQKKSALSKLEARRGSLKEKGLSDEAIAKDVTTRRLKADVRKADFRLASIAAQEKLNASVAKATAEKKAAGKTPKKEAKGKEKEKAPEKKEKKAKKEKPAKEAKPQGKKEEPEEPKEQPQAE